MPTANDLRQLARLHIAALDGDLRGWVARLSALARMRNELAAELGMAAVGVELTGADGAEDEVVAAASKNGVASVCEPCAPPPPPRPAPVTPPPNGRPVADGVTGPDAGAGHPSPPVPRPTYNGYLPGGLPPASHGYRPPAGVNRQSAAMAVRRRKLACLMITAGPMTFSAVRRFINLGSGSATATLNHEWFCRAEDGRWCATAEGVKAAKGGGCESTAAEDGKDKKRNEVDDGQDNHFPLG